MEEKRLKYLQIWRRLAKIYKYPHHNPVGSKTYIFPCCWITPLSYGNEFHKQWLKLTAEMMIQEVTELSNQYNIKFSYAELMTLKQQYKEGCMLSWLDHILLKQRLSTIQRASFVNYFAQFRKKIRT